MRGLHTDARRFDGAVVGVVRELRPHTVSDHDQRPSAGPTFVQLPRLSRQLHVSWNMHDEVCRRIRASVVVFLQRASELPVCQQRVLQLCSLRRLAATGTRLHLQIPRRRLLVHWSAYGDNCFDHDNDEHIDDHRNKDSDQHADRDADVDIANRLLHPRKQQLRCQ